MSRFPLEVPPELRDLIPGFTVDKARLHAAHVLPDYELPVWCFGWQLDLPWWSHGGEPFKITPRQVAADPVAHLQHYWRAMMADLAYPIIVREERLAIFDGVHRLLRACMEGRYGIKLCILSDAELRKYESCERQ